MNSMRIIKRDNVKSISVFKQGNTWAFGISTKDDRCFCGRKFATEKEAQEACDDKIEG